MMLNESLNPTGWLLLVKLSSVIVILFFVSMLNNEISLQLAATKWQQLPQNQYLPTL